MHKILLSSALAGCTLAAALSAASCSSSSKAGDAGSSEEADSGDGGSSSGAPVCMAYVTDANLTTPVVSFKNDVMPLFEHQCGLSSSCHYDPSVVGTLGIYLGCDITIDGGTCNVANPTPGVYQDLVGGPDGGPLTPLEIMGMPYVTPGNAEQSYIMHKMDNDLCTLTGCKTDNVAVENEMDLPNTLGPGLPANWCGGSMPLNSDLLPASPACGGSQDCTPRTAYTRDTVRLWIAQGAMNN